MRLFLGRLRDLIKEVTDAWDPDVHPPTFQGHFGDEDDAEFERQYTADSKKWELEFEAERLGRWAASAWLSSGTDVDADQWIEDVIAQHAGEELDPELVRAAFDDMINRQHSSM